MANIPIKIKKAIYVSEQLCRYFYTTMEALDDWCKNDGLFSDDNFQSPDALYQKFKEIVFNYMSTHPDTLEVKNDFIITMSNMPIPIIILISATLKLGKLKRFTSIKSMTYPLTILSIRFPIPPESINTSENKILKLTCSFLSFMNFIIIPKTTILDIIIKIKLLEPIPNATPVFSVYVKLSMLGIIIRFFPLNIALVIWSNKIILIPNIISTTFLFFIFTIFPFIFYFFVYHNYTKCNT